MEQCKVCDCCGSTKSIDDFYRLKSGNHRKDCKPCLVQTAVDRRRIRVLDQQAADKQRKYRREYKRKLRVLKVESQGKIYVSLFDKRQRKLAKKNAVQAWEWWLNVKADRLWLDEYYSGNAWKDHRLNPGDIYRVRYREDESFAIKERIRNQLTKAAKRSGIADHMRQAINRQGNSSVVESKLGYTIQELTTHLERQFSKGMTWGSFKRGEIHIDHVRPQASFDLSNNDEWSDCWSLPNLQPLWAKDNLEKSDKNYKLL